VSYLIIYVNSLLVLQTIYGKNVAAFSCCGKVLDYKAKIIPSRMSYVLGRAKGGGEGVIPLLAEAIGEFCVGKADKAIMAFS